MLLYCAVLLVVVDQISCTEQNTFNKHQHSPHFSPLSLPPIMSSEKYELAQDELDSLMEKIGADVRKTGMSSGEAKKRMVQVRDLMLV